ncbi:MAG: CHAT domain-containing protein [Deltaproteobacteria bacterium]|nr:CHAT domain-containing protein [Deltaproteobacteria bacterium]
MRALACLLLTLLLAAGCQRKAKPVSAALPEVASAGCIEALGSVCVLDEQRTLRFWVPTVVDGLRATTDVGSPSLKTLPIQGGTFIAVQVPAKASSLTLSSNDVPFERLTLQSWKENPVLASARVAAKTDLRAAQVQLEQALPGADPVLAARIKSLLGRIHMQAGRYDDAMALLQASEEAFVASGLRFAASEDKIAMSFIASTRRSDAKGAMQLLLAANALGERGRALSAEIDYQRGLVESMVGNVRGALGFVKEALRWAQRLQITNVEVAAQQWLAMTLSSLGRTNEALAIQLQLVDRLPTNPCLRAPVLATAAWLSLLQKPIDATQTETRLQNARQELQACPDPFRARNQTLNEISFSLSQRKYGEAEQELRPLRASSEGRTAALSVLELELEGRLALAQHQATAALHAFDRAETLANAAGLGDEALRMRVWRAEALAETGQTHAAIRSLEEAEHMLDQRLQLVPVGEGRIRFLQMRDQGVRALVNLHLRAGDVKDAFAAARRGRSRALRGVALGEQLAGLTGQARSKWISNIAEYQKLRANAEDLSETWSLSEAELHAQADLKFERDKRAQEALDKAYADLVGSLKSEAALPDLNLAPGDLALLFIKEPETDGNKVAWRGFAATSTDVKTSLLSAPSVGFRDHPWLLPFADAIERATRIRILFTDAGTEEIHKAAFKQRPLQNHAPVVYSLDITSAAPASGRPLVVADPSDDLPSSRVEGQDVAEKLKVSMSDNMLLGAASTRRAVMTALPTAGWFHYAGHSVFAGEEGLESGLPLAQRQRLLAADVLALPAVPRVVVLSSCEAGRSSGDSNTAGLGLAQAFVVAGAKVVIAPTRAVSDEVSRDFMRLFYKHVSSGLPPERALQTTLSEANAQQENDWSTFRALVP